MSTFQSSSGCCADKIWMLCGQRLDVVSTTSTCRWINIYTQIGMPGVPFQNGTPYEIAGMIATQWKESGGKVEGKTRPPSTV